MFLVNTLERFILGIIQLEHLHRIVLLTEDLHNNVHVNIHVRQQHLVVYLKQV